MIKSNKDVKNASNDVTSNKLDVKEEEEKDVTNTILNVKKKKKQLGCYNHKLGHGGKQKLGCDKHNLGFEKHTLECGQ